MSTLGSKLEGIGNKYFCSRYALMLALFGIFGVLSGCTTAPVEPVQVLVPQAIPCTSAAEVPPQPSRALALDAAAPGAAVKAVEASRRRWIGYADALKTKLEACQ